MIEQVIDGSLNTISSANKAFEDMVLGPDGKIYIAEIDYNSSTMSGKLYSYTYSADTPTVPDTELTLFILWKTIPAFVRLWPCSKKKISGYLSDSGNGNVRG